MTGSLAAMQPPAGDGSTQQPRLPPPGTTLDLSSRETSFESGLSQGSGSPAPSEHNRLISYGSPDLDDGTYRGAGLPAAAAQPPAAGTSTGSAAAHDVLLPRQKKPDAKSSALKALAGVSAVVSKSRRVDAEALQTIKKQRAKARAEGHPPHAAAAPTAAPMAAAAAAFSTAGSAPPPPLPPPSDSPSISPFASAFSQSMARDASASNLTALHSLGHGHGSAALTSPGSLPTAALPFMGRPRRSPPGTPPAADYDMLVSGMSITELVALKQAVEGQLTKQALALVQLQACSGGGMTAQHAQHADVLSQQYASLLLRDAQQAQLVQQLSAQQHAVTAAAIQQALVAAAASAGLSTQQSFTLDQLMLPASGQAAPPPSTAPSLAQYGSLPLPGDPSISPFACAPFPGADSGVLGLTESQRLPSLSLPPPLQHQHQQHTHQQQQQGRGGGGGGGGQPKSGGSPQSAVAEQRLIGEALHCFLDPERQGPPSRQGSALAGTLSWLDRRSSACMPAGLPPSGGGGGGGTVPSALPRSPVPQPPCFSRSRSMSQAEGLFGEGHGQPSSHPPHNPYGRTGQGLEQQAQQAAQQQAQQQAQQREQQQLSSLFSALCVDALAPQQPHQQQQQHGGVVPLSNRSASLQLPLSLGQGSQPLAGFGEGLLLHPYQ